MTRLDLRSDLELLNDTVPPVNTEPTRRDTLKSLLAVAASSALTGCGAVASIGNRSLPGSSKAQVNPQPTPSGPLGSVTLSVTTASLGIIVPQFIGVSWEKAMMAYTPYFLSTANTGLVNLLQLLGPGVLRIGANTVDQTSWVPNGASIPGQVTEASVSALAAFVEAIGWQCIYGVNLGGVGPFPHTGVNSQGSFVASTTPALAAAEVAYASAELGTSLLGVEIGNEPDSYGSTYFENTYWDFPAFQAVWTTFRDAILARTPGLTITGPASPDTGAPFSIPFAQCETGSQVSLLTQHYYRADGNNTSYTDSFTLSADTGLAKFLAKVYTAAQTESLPLRIAECGCYYFNSSPPSDEAKADTNGYCCALWMIDFLFGVAMAGATGINLHSGGGTGSSNSPFIGSGTSLSQICGEFYGMYLFTQAGQGTMYTTTFSGLNGLNVTGYAVATSSGGLNLVINNKDTGMNNLQVTINLPQSVSTANLYLLTQSTAGAGPNLEATSGITFQGGSFGNSGSFSPSAPYTLTITNGGTQLTCYVPYYSAVLIQAS